LVAADLPGVLVHVPDPACGYPAPLVSGHHLAAHVRLAVPLCTGVCKGLKVIKALGCPQRTDVAREVIETVRYLEHTQPVDERTLRHIQPLEVGDVLRKDLVGRGL